MKKIIQLSLLIMAIFFYSKAYPADWYVDNIASGANNGTSWTNAWASFAGISWGSIQGGDMIYISGGSTSKTYTTRFVVGGSGFTDNYITIQTGQDATHNGTVIIDGPTYSGIEITARTWIKISGQVGAGNDCKMRITDNPQQGIYIAGASDHIILEYLEIDNNGATDPAAGIFSSFNPSPTDIEIHHCDIHDNYRDGMHLGEVITEPTQHGEIKIHHNKIYNVYDDGIESGMGSLEIYNNEIYDRIVPPDDRGHPDGLQLYDGYLKIYNNYFHNWYVPTDFTGAGEGYHQVIYIEPDGCDQGRTYDQHDILIYNNLFVETDTYVSDPITYATIAIKLDFSDDDWSEVYNVYVLNNTFSGDFVSATMINFSGTSPTHATVHDFYVMNNIYYNASYNVNAWTFGKGANDDITHGSYGDAMDVTVDYNCYYGNGTTHVGYGTSLTYAAFRTATGCQDNDVTTDPSLDSNFKPDSVTDPIVDVGVDQASFFTTDKDGNYRPQLTAWDIGAYEFGSSPAPPVRSGGSPTGTLPSGTTSTTLSLITNKNATCRYLTTAGVSYSSMTNTFSTTGGTSHSTTISGLSDGDSYSYCVRCQDDSGNANTTDYGISFSVDVPPRMDVPDSEPPTIPSGLQASPVSSSQINLTWTASTDDVGVTGYRIYRDEFEVDTSPTNSYPDNTGLSPSTTYTYTVSAYDAEWNESRQSSSASATTSEASAFIEAESITTTSPMQIVSDAEASGGAYIQTTQVDSGTAAYTFNIDESGIYKIIASGYALDAAHDSFYVKIDEGEEFVWHLNPSDNPDEFNVWREDEVNNQGTGTWDNPQYDPYNIELTQGTHTITFRGRETNCRLDYFYFSKVEELSYNWFQAESENITSPLETALDPDASAGTYMWKPSGSGNSATPDGAAEYTIDIPTTGDYVIWGRVIAPDGGSDSFFTSIDGGEDLAWDVPIGSVWTWNSVNGNGQDPLVFNLAAGTHTLKISGSEDGTKLDRLLITNDMDFVPSEENPDNVPPHAVRNLRIE